MANENKPDTNHSQFFITLDATEYLYGKHTIFGKVVGNTLFNVLKMGDLQTDANDYPLYPPSIRSVSIVNNPFPDIIPRYKFDKQSILEKSSKPSNLMKSKVPNLDPNKYVITTYSPLPMMMMMKMKASMLLSSVSNKPAVLSKKKN